MHSSENMSNPISSSLVVNYQKTSTRPTPPHRHRIQVVQASH